MALSLVTAPTFDPIDLDEAKKHLRVDADDDDGLINTLITAAREYAESYTHRALITQTWDLKLDAFPCSGEAIELPKPPVASVTSVTYLDTAGATQTWSSSLYLTDLPVGPKSRTGRITPIFAGYYPSTYGVMNAVTVRFVCGFTTAALVPSGIKAAMLLMIGSWYQNREQVLISQFAGQFIELPGGVNNLLFPYVAW